MGTYDQVREEWISEDKVTKFLGMFSSPWFQKGSSRRKVGKEMPESSNSNFLEKLLANSFALSDTEDNTFRLLNKGGIADFSLLRTLLAIHQKSQEPSF